METAKDIIIYYKMIMLKLKFIKTESQNLVVGVTTVRIIFYGQKKTFSTKGTVQGEKLSLIVN